MTNKKDGIFKIIKDIYNILKFELIFYLMKNLGISTETKRRMVNDFCVFIGAGNLPLPLSK